jgi:phosphomannomutase
MDIAAAIEAAERWAIHDPEARFRSQLDQLIDASDEQLIELFDGRIAFGTAGLRAAVGPGPRRMNALVVRQATVGVVAALQASGIDSPSVVIGFDARHDSADFAGHVAGAVAASGGTAKIASAPLPTPVIAHAVLAEGADAGIVITASHNPPADNGYKLYLGDGRQLVDPWDSEIAAAIDQVAAVWRQHGPAIDDACADLSNGVEVAGLQVVDASNWAGLHRHAAVAATAPYRPTGEQLADPLRIVYTPMHGVGGPATLATFADAGLEPLLITESQFAPDPDFATVAFPNPEEPGALDDALAVAAAVEADAVFAHDPDADRLAVAVRTRSGDGLVALRGDELGVLLGDFLIQHSDGDRLVARSVVSSRMLDAVAAAAGVTCQATLTGFKWIARAVEDHPGKQWLFGYEEAIGYSVGEHVRDKDGITAALVAHAALSDLRAHGRTVWDRFDELAAVHGVYASRPVTLRFDDDPAAIARVVDGLVASPPAALAGSPVTAGPIGGGKLPPTSGVELLAEDQTRVIVRPSGTEPKVKAYVEVIEPVAPGGGTPVAIARAEAEARLTLVCDEVRGLLQGSR